MKFILWIIVIILAITFVSFLLPAIIGVLIGISMIKSGSVIGGLIVIAVGIGANIAMVYGSFAEGGSSTSYLDEECPYCGSGDTDGNHCYTCDEEF